MTNQTISNAPSLEDKEFLDSLMNFEPLLTEEQVNQGERQEKDRGRQRRMMLAILTKSSDELFQTAEKSPDVTEEAFHLVNDYISDLKSLLEMSIACSSRLMFSLSHLETDKFQIIMDDWAEATNLNSSTN